MIPATRAEALRALEEFVPRLPAYAAGRNHVGKPSVSRLSAAIRHRLVLEEEVVARSLAAHAFPRIEKWIQEVLWRTYWKGWLEVRPGIWKSFVERAERLPSELPPAVVHRAREVAAGRSGVAVMDRFARELLETGYVHNHARMWWASFWIHVERLPWELGAAHYFRHLHDADPASNTLSWRWVAGLQTRGKSYLVRRSNLERYCEPLETEGLDRLDDSRVSAAAVVDAAEADLRSITPYGQSAVSGPCMLWLHEDDLVPEVGPLADTRPECVVALEPAREGKGAYQRKAIEDALQRAAAHYDCPAHLVATLDDLAARSGGLPVVAFAPFVGPARSSAHELRERLPCQFVRREWDERFFPHAVRGFFPFWAAVSRELAR